MCGSRAKGLRFPAAIGGHTALASLNRAAREPLAAEMAKVLLLPCMPVTFGHNTLVAREKISISLIYPHISNVAVQHLREATIWLNYMQ